MKPITVDIFHDTVCPWCRIGIHSMRLAAKELGAPVEFRFRSFFLDPIIPFEGVPFAPLMEEKIGGKEQMDLVHEQITKTGASIGVEFDFSKIALMPNSLMSHQVIRLAPDKYRMDVVDAIEHAYFVEGRDIGDREVLLDIAEKAGLDREYISEFVGTEVRLKEIDEDIRQAFEIGVSQIPFFVINGKYAVRGAQPPQAFLQALKTV
ncbi:DsbA family oxidoreductase [Paenibacillus albiflavus]|uniref:DsbA family oxidoreductase n=1 Tax=Paenibacillus albiflavus TaxID=2545760 RepID=A0A4V6P6C0_9BACL|nr:DsbA family oxidoreductase [Paenibacillus albiflavus]TCZ77422.1 DsbA family oxidoreductase [Paenibacillus albiflavus]